MGWDRSEFDRQRYFERKDLLLDFLGRECISCGSTDLIEFDHIDPSTKKFSIMSKWNSPMEVLIPEIRKCQPLCHNCHKEKSKGPRSVDHGEGASGKKNCKCSPCKDRKNEYMRAWKSLNKKPVVAGSSPVIRA